MRNHRRWLIVGVVAGPGLLGLLALYTLSEPRIDAERFEKIQVGMTPEQVQSLIGVPPGNYTHGQLKIIHDVGLEGSSDFYKEWVGEEIAILVWLDDAGKVSRKESVQTSNLLLGRERFLDRVRRWLRW
jgi:hypothetical protein